MHIDNSGPLKMENDRFKEDYMEGKGLCPSVVFIPNLVYNRGAGVSLRDQPLSGGIFIASSVRNSCRLYNCKIVRDPTNSSEIIGENGDCEHIKEFLPADKEVVLEENKLYWITDRTPHKSLPLENGTYLQFIRVVTANLSHWSAHHSTPNPCGVQPDPNRTQIVKGNKFIKNSLKVIELEKYFEYDLKCKKTILSRMKCKISKESHLTH